MKTSGLRTFFILSAFHLIASVIWLGQARAFPRAQMPDLPSLRTDILYNSDPVDTLANKRPNDFLVTVNLTNKNDDQQICTGTLLAPDLVITAAHCLNDVESAKFGFVEYLVSPNPRKYAKVPVKSWKVNENYARGMPIDERKNPQFADFALIALKKPVPGRRAIKLVPRYFEWSQITPDPKTGHAEWARVLGSYRDENLQVQKQFAFAGLRSIEMLSSSIYKANIEAGRGWCVGDSGGPVVLFADMDGRTPDFILVGVAYSFQTITGLDFSGNEKIQSTWKGKSIPTCGQSIYFTPVLTHLDWIIEAIDELFDDGKTRITFLGES